MLKAQNGQGMTYREQFRGQAEKHQELTEPSHGKFVAVLHIQQWSEPVLLPLILIETFQMPAGPIE